MNRRNFALSWGRKMFFGVAWPVTAVLMFFYLQSQLLPQGPLSWIYFLVTAVGFSGLITAVCYFLFYSPMIALFPSYYFSRLWGLFLILLVNLALFFDSMIFAQFRFHVNKFVAEIVMGDGLAAVFESRTTLILAGVLAMIITLTYWIQGNRIWRMMQKRFNNPVKNWYLAIVVACLAISHALYQSENFQQFGKGRTLASLFPLNYQSMFFPKSASHKVLAKFTYPKKKLNCTGKSNPNITIITLSGWKEPSFTEATFPFLYHLPDHGTSFLGHRYPAHDHDEGVFGLLYGIPAYYADQARAYPPAILEEAKKRGYLLFVRSSFPSMSNWTEVQSEGQPLAQQWKSWSEGKSGPYFTFIDYNLSDPMMADTEFKDFFNLLYELNLMKESAYVVTGSHTTGTETTPLYVIWPDRRKGEWNHFTDHHDVAATLMQNLWGCKNKFADYSEGKSLFLGPDKDWDAFGNENELIIVDHKNGGTVASDWNGNVAGGTNARSRGLLMTALRGISRFYRE
jgi:membrane-anchored protein YejM (alkaline phosphatase superfamily)